MSYESKEWDLEKVYDEQISPLMTQIIAVCKEHDLPFLATFEYASGGYLCTSAQRREGMCDTLTEIRHAVLRGRSAPMHLTVRDGEGHIMRMETIL